jgi:hypothetical protein
MTPICAEAQSFGFALLQNFVDWVKGLPGLLVPLFHAELFVAIANNLVYPLSCILHV